MWMWLTKLTSSCACAMDQNSNINAMLFFFKKQKKNAMLCRLAQLPLKNNRCDDRGNDLTGNGDRPPTLIAGEHKSIPQSSHLCLRDLTRLHT